MKNFTPFLYQILYSSIESDYKRTAYVGFIYRCKACWNSIRSYKGAFHILSRSCPIQTIPLYINYNILVINSTYILFSLNRKNPINYANFVT